MATSAVSANKAELLAIADAVAREKLIDREIVIEAMEDAIQRAAKARYGAENDIRAKLDPNIAEGCNRFLQKYKRDYEQMKARVNEHAWDGDWYVRYFDHDGSAIAW